MSATSLFGYCSVTVSGAPGGGVVVAGAAGAVAALGVTGRGGRWRLPEG